jgi:hypothetical protein
LPWTASSRARCRSGNRAGQRLPGEGLVQAQQSKQQKRNELAELRAPVAQLQQEVVQQRDTMTQALHYLFGKTPGNKESVLGNFKHRIDSLDKQGIEHFELQYDGERLLTVTNGRVVKSVKLPLPIYRGVYQAGQEYELGDMISFGGSVWIAKANTSEKPGEGPTAWTLAIKRGRDGRDGKDKAA